MITRSGLETLASYAFANPTKGIPLALTAGCLFRRRSHTIWGKEALTNDGSGFSETEAYFGIKELLSAIEAFVLCGNTPSVIGTLKGVCTSSFRHAQLHCRLASHRFAPPFCH